MSNFFSLPALEQVAALKRNFPKLCTNCGRRYTLKRWNRLPNARLWKMPWGEVQELRECVCGSTLSIILLEGERDE